MNSKSTTIWFVMAAALFGFILAFEHYWEPPAAGPSAILPDLRPAAVTSIQVFPAGALEIRADRDRTNGIWLLTKPMLYPAQPAAIETLLTALGRLAPAARLSPAEFRDGHNANAEFGFDSPQLSVVIETDNQRWQLWVGNKTAPGDQVFLRVVGEGAFVTDADWLKLVPHAAGDWRDTALADFHGSTPDGIVLSNVTKGLVMEFYRDATNHLWRMTRPSPARADSERINTALQQLQGMQVSQFITDDPKADPGAFGLEPADIDLSVSRGTNLITGLQVGKSPSNQVAQVYVRRDGWNAIMTTPREPLSLWWGQVNDFRDPYLLELTAPVTEIEVSGENNFTLRREGTNAWRVAGEKFTVDSTSVQEFIKILAGLRVAEGGSGFVKDVVTAPDLPAYGLATPTRQITIRSADGGTNAVIGQLSFGATQGKQVFVRRADEDFVYAITPEDFSQLPMAGWEFRDRHLWDFSETNVASVTLHQNGKTRQIVRNGPGKWSLAPGSQGVINDLAMEEVTHRLGELTAVAWLARGLPDPGKFGLKADNLQIAIELKSGAKYTVDFGGEVSSQTALAAVTLDGERWALVFPPVLYQLVLSYLTIPANAP